MTASLSGWRHAARFLSGCAMSVAACLVPPQLNALAEEQDSLVVLELFTSQSCYSCPPAEELLAEHYLHMEGVLPLELHVDYWDDLIYGLAGKWKDVWSDPAYTERQYRYNKLIRGRASAYTPQFIISGAYEAAGTRKEKIDRTIREVRDNAALKSHKIKVRLDGEGRNVATVTGPEIEGKVFGIVYEKHSVTVIEGGENNGKTLANYNIVKRITPLEPTGENEYRLGPINSATEGCAFIVQDPPIGVIRAAARCRPPEEAG